MEFLIDFLCVAVLILFCIGHRKHTLFSAGTSVLCYALAFAMAFLISAPVGNVINKQLVAPIVQTNVADDLADMCSAEHKDTPVETLKALPLNQLFIDQSSSIEQLARQYQQSVKSLWNAYKQGGEKALLNTLTDDAAYAISRSLVLAVTFVLLALVLRLISKRIESNLPPVVQRKGWHRVLAMGCGLLVGAIWVETVAIILSWVVPYGAGAVLFLDSEAWQQSLVHRFSPFLTIV